MRSDDVFVVARHDITLPRKGGTIKIMPFGDVHYDTKLCDQDRFHAWLDRCKRDDDEYTRYISAGDLFDFCSTSERQKLAMARLHNTTAETLDDMQQAKVYKMIERLWFMRGRLLGMIQGNHYWTFNTDPDGTATEQTSVERMCQKLECPWLGSIAVIHISVNFEGCGTRSQLQIVIAHGKSGGKLIGTSINQVEDMFRIFPGADIYLMGHNHKKGGLTSTRLFVDCGANGTPTVRQHKQVFSRTGSFKRGYVAGQGSYEAGRLYQATDLGVVRVEADFERVRKVKHPGTDQFHERMVKSVHVWS